MIISREEKWGVLSYDTKKHIFNIEEDENKDISPYIGEKPVVLNIDLTFECNMKCDYCVAMDMKNHNFTDLKVNNKLINWINKSPFLVIVITGGEPLLPAKEKNLILLLTGINNKGIIIDTNGTIRPSKKLIQIIKKKDILVRISQDSVNPNIEISYRKISNDKIENYNLFMKKIENIKWFKSKGIPIAIQTVLSKKNEMAILDMPKFLSNVNIKKWYIQRLILSHNVTDENKSLREKDYIDTLNKIKRKCDRMGIEFYSKKEKRHNSVFLLTGNGQIFTQGEKPKQKVWLGSIKSSLDYFSYVSSSDHSIRYYGDYWEPTGNRPNLIKGGNR